MIFPFLLLGLACLQSFTMADNAKGIEECCFTFVKTAIPLRLLQDYRETRTDCAYRGVIFSLFDGRRACGNASLGWVQQSMKRIDQRQYENSTPPVNTS